MNGQGHPLGWEGVGLVINPMPHRRSNMRSASFALVGVLVMTGVLTAVYREDNGLPKEAAAILGKAEQIEMYSLDPLATQEERKAAKEKTKQGWVVLGKTVVKDAKALK